MKVAASGRRSKYTPLSVSVSCWWYTWSLWYFTSRTLFCSLSFLFWLSGFLPCFLWGWLHPSVRERLCPSLFLERFYDGTLSGTGGSSVDYLLTDLCAGYACRFLRVNWTRVPLSHWPLLCRPWRTASRGSMSMAPVNCVFFCRWSFPVLPRFIVPLGFYSASTVSGLVIGDMCAQ